MGVYFDMKAKNCSRTWQFSRLFLLCDRLLDLSISSKKCPKFIIVIDINFIMIQDHFIAQPYLDTFVFASHVGPIIIGLSSAVLKRNF